MVPSKPVRSGGAAERGPVYGDRLKGKNILTGGMVALLLLLGIFLIRGYLNGHFDSPETLRTYVGSFGPFSPVILTVIQALQVVLPVLPGFLGCIVGAGLFGAAGGFWWKYIGISAGSILAFLLARRVGVGVVRKMFAAKKYDECVGWVRMKKSLTVLLS